MTATAADGETGVLAGVMNTLHAALPVMTAGGSAIVTGSFAALMKGGVGSEPGGMAYSYAKRQLVDYVRWIAAAAAPQGIRVNGIHPTNCNTRLLNNDGIYQRFRPDLENPTREDAMAVFPVMQAMPIPTSSRTMSASSSPSSPATDRAT